MRGFHAKRTIKSCEINVKATPEKVFPLLCPVREYEWIESWKCEVVYAASGHAEQDCVFRTGFPDDGHDVWVVSRYEPDREIEFVRVNGFRAMRYSFSLRENGDGTTAVSIKQVSTALNPKGNELLGKPTDEEFFKEKKILEAMLDHFLAAGKMLPLKEAEARVLSDLK